MNLFLIVVHIAKGNCGKIRLTYTKKAHHLEKCYVYIMVNRINL